MKLFKQINHYFKQKRIKLRQQEKEQDFELEVVKIQSMLLQGKSVKESVRLFEEVKERYLKSQSKKLYKLSTEVILLNTHLKKE